MWEFSSFALQSGLSHLDLDRRRAVVLDEGHITASASTLSRIAEAVVKIMDMPEKMADKTVYIRSFNPM